MAGYSKYPFELDSSLEIPTIIDKINQVNADVVNRYKDGIFAIEAELGIQPSSTYDTVRHRLDALEAALNTLREILNNFDPSGAVVDLTAIINAINLLNSQVSTIQTDITNIEGDITTLNSQVSQAQTDIQILYALYNSLLQRLQDGYYNLGSNSTSGLCKRRVFISSNQITSVNTPTTIQFNSNSTLYTPTNSSLTSFSLSATSSLEYRIQGAATFAPLQDVPVSGITISVLLNGTPIQSYFEYGSIWSRDIPKTLPFSLTARLTPSDSVSVRWTHSGASGSQSVCLSGDSRTWFEIVSI